MILMRNFLKLKQLQENELKINENIYLFESQLSSLHDTILFSHVLTSAKSSIQALKDFKLSDEDIEIFDQIEKIDQPLIDAIEILKISQNGNHNLVIIDDVEDAQLQKELDILIMQESIKELPDVPTSDFQPTSANKIPLLNSY
ncbi:hypothetical protein MXB_120 [Myxobolus squamalis]|nr:hypothetical protein MXB_120 [Myxobolus squamalis]